VNSKSYRKRARSGATLVACVAACALVCRPCPAPAAELLSLDRAVATALAHHPRVVAARAVVSVARALVDEAYMNELPMAGVSGQINHSTGNSVPGAFFTTPFIPSVSGSPLGRSLTGDVWQSGASVWGDVDIGGFPQKLAITDAAIANRSGAGAALRGRELQTAFDVANGFVLLLEAHEQVRSARASVERAKTFSVVVKSLVDQSLRPGADAARVVAVVALAETQVARAEEVEAVRRAELAEAMGEPNDAFDVDPGGLLRPVEEPGPWIAVVPVATHPLVQERVALVARSRAFARAVHLEYLPRLDLVASLWARGSGSYPGGVDLGSMTGVVPDTPNYAVGLIVTWPLLNWPSIAARSRAADARTAEAVARRDDVALAVTGEVARARAMLDGARRVARNTPVALTAARAAEAQAVARYRAALVSVLDVADAQRVLALAEIEDALARLETRRALLYLARATGDLEPFFADARKGGP
jgi:outer membrane protein